MKHFNRTARDARAEPRSLRLPSVIGAGPGCLILHERARRHHWQGRGWLSVKSFVSGQGIYRVGPARFAVDPEVYLLLNEDQTYAVELEGRVEAESFCVFFEPGLASEVHRAMAANCGTLLDDPFPPAGQALSFFERTYAHDSVFSRLQTLRATLFGPNEPLGLIQEEVCSLLQGMLLVHEAARLEARDFPGKKPATRIELYRRLHRARDFMRASLDRDVQLADIAGVACLSPNHLIRAFRHAFGLTPHQYLIGLRMTRAAHLLRHTNLPVGQVCLEVGFRAPGSFSWLFARRFGCPPSAFRAKKGDFGEAWPRASL